MKPKLLIFPLIIIMLASPILGAWWNYSYDYRLNVSCTNMDDNIPIILNGSNGFLIDGQNQTLHTYCRGTGTALYYNNYTDYVVANDTDRLPFEVEYGNRTSYLPESVWNSSYFFVQHLNEDPSGSAPQIIGSTSNAYNGTSSGSMTTSDQVTGVIDGSLYFDGTNDQINFNTVTGSFKTIMFWAKSDIVIDGIGGTPHAIIGSTNFQNVMLCDGSAHHLFPNEIIVIQTGEHRFNYWQTGTIPSIDTNWHHYAFIWSVSCSEYVLFFDNVNKGAALVQAGSDLAASYPNMKIGAYNTNLWDGKLDNLHLSSHPMSPSQIGQSYNNAINTAGYGDLATEETYYVPTVTSTRIYPSPIAASGNNLEGFCNASDDDGEDVRYFWIWYLNDSVYSSSNSSLYYPEGEEINVDNISWPVTSVRDIWSFSCRAYDGHNYSSWVNTTVNTTINNIINVSFYDAETLILVDDRTITVQFIGKSEYDITTNNGDVYLENLSYGHVSILYDAEGYQQGKYILSVSDTILQNISLYLQNSSTSSLVLITVEDRFGARLQDVEVTIQRWTNGTWRTEQILVTDFNGQTEGYYVISSVYYNHILEYDGIVRFGAINDDENKKIIYTEDVSNGINFYIDVLGEDVLSDWQYIDGIITNLTYVSYTNTTGYFRFFWITEDNTAVEGCIHVFKHGNLTFNCSSCATSDTAILTACTVNQTDRGIATYYVIGIIDDYVTDDLIVRIGVNATGAAGKPIDWGSAGYLFGFFIVLLTFFMFLENPTVSILAGTFVFCLLSGLNVMFPNLSYGILIGIMAVGVIIALITSKSGVNA